MQTNSTPAAGAKLAREQTPTQGNPVDAPPAPTSQKVHFPGEDGGRSLNEMAQRDLSATLQLLAERAQYITGATGAAIALREGDDIVCRASAGSVAPEMGAHLQVDSGLSGESIRTRQVLRCDDAQTDPRVNRESCEALGIASVVVMVVIPPPRWGPCVRTGSRRRRRPRRTPSSPRAACVACRSSRTPGSRPVSGARAARGR